MRSGLIAGCPPPPSMYITMQSAVSNSFSFFGHPSRAMIGNAPGVCFSRSIRIALPAKNS